MDKTFLLVIILTLSGCQQMMDTFGLSRNKPDEYGIVELPPLTIPPNYKTLPQPVEESKKSRALEKAKAIFDSPQKIAQDSKAPKASKTPKDIS